MNRRIFFEDARKNILELFSVEFPNLAIDNVEQIINMLYKLANYEEEGKKIRPSIILTSNISSVIKYCPGSKKITFYEDIDSSNFKAHIKSLMVFCIRGWSIYLNFSENGIEYGIIKRLSSLKEESLTQMLSRQDVLDSISRRTSLVTLTILGGGVCRLSGARGNTTSVCFNLNSGGDYNWETDIYDFVEACVSKIKTTPRKLTDIKNLLYNILNNVLKDLHGTICLVVDKDFNDNSGLLSDGTWLKEPIEFVKLFMRSNHFDENTLRSFADVLATMLDFDGITIIDNSGRIRAYNVFIESNNSQKIVGGARKRAAYTLLQSKVKRIIGVYFQSQDGDNFYKEKSDLKKKKQKIKIVDGQVVTDTTDMLPLEVIANLEIAKKKEQEKEKEKFAKEKEKFEKEKEKLEKEKEKLEKAKQEQIDKSRPSIQDEPTATSNSINEPSQDTVEQNDIMKNNSSTEN